MDWKLSSSRERAGSPEVTLGDHGGCPKTPPGRGNFSCTSMHYYSMDCDTFRAAISTQIDGEAPWLPPDALATHLAGCPACRDWQRRAHTVTRRVRLGGAFLDHDLAPRVLAAVPIARDRGRLRLARRGLLIVLALAQLAIAGPMLFLGHDHDAGLHAAAGRLGCVHPIERKDEQHGRRKVGELLDRVLNRVTHVGYRCLVSKQ